MNKAIIVKDDVRELNEFLDDGWKVESSCPMPSSCAIGDYSSMKYFQPTCLVILTDGKKTYANQE